MGIQTRLKLARKKDFLTRPTVYINSTTLHGIYISSSFCVSNFLIIFFLTGLYGIYVSCQAKSARDRNDIESAKHYSQTAKTVFKVAVAVGLVLLIVNIILKFAVRVPQYNRIYP